MIQNKPHKEDLRHFYIEENMSQKEIAQRYGISQTTVQRLLKKYGIYKNPKQEKKLFTISLEWVQRLFVK